MPDLTTFSFANSNADGSVVVDPAGMSFALTGGNLGSGIGSGSSTFSGTSSGAGLVSFSFVYDTLDDPGFDSGGYYVDGIFNELAQMPDSGDASFLVNAGSVYGFYVNTVDNQNEPGVLSITFSTSDGTATPEPALALFVPLFLLAAWLHRRLVRLSRVNVLTIVAVAACGPASSFAQTQNNYIGTNISGQLVLVRTVNLSSFQQQSLTAFAARAASGSSGLAAGTEISKLPASFPHPALGKSVRSLLSSRGMTANAAASGPLTSAQVPSQGVATGGAGFGFEALSHFDQRNANSGNQFSVEPPNPSIAVANGLVLEGVNNAVRVFDAVTGAPRTATVSSNQLFGVAPAIDRSTGANGVYPTDMRVFYDSDIHRWFVLQRAQDNDIFGNALDQSHLYLAVSQTADPTGNYNIYVMDTTNFNNQGCPCVPDFPQIGADQYGFYVSANEYNTSSVQFVDAEIFAISKVSLAAGVLAPTTSRFLLPRVTGFEFTVHPASTPLGASQFLASGGLEYFVSSQSSISTDSHLAVWALTNTASLQTANPTLLLTQTSLSTLEYSYPFIATQRPGPLPYGDSVGGSLAFLDGGIDSRILSLTYAGGRLFATMATEIFDDSGHSSVGGAYVIISPVYRNGVLGAAVLRQGFISVSGNHVLRPAIAVNAQGKGAIAFTLAGPDYYPSAASLSLDTVTTSPTIRITAAGAGPEDGFTGYQNAPFAGVARWGDYSTAVVGTDGAIWMVSEYISGGPRTTLANWSTYVARYVP